MMYRRTRRDLRAGRGDEGKSLSHITNWTNRAINIPRNMERTEVTFMRHIGDRTNTEPQAHVYGVEPRRAIDPSA
jgi:hypothetical protein